MCASAEYVVMWNMWTTTQLNFVMSMSSGNIRILGMVVHRHNLTVEIHCYGMYILYVTV